MATIYNSLRGKLLASQPSSVDENFSLALDNATPGSLPNNAPTNTVGLRLQLTPTPDDAVIYINGKIFNLNGPQSIDIGCVPGHSDGIQEWIDGKVNGLNIQVDGGASLAVSGTFYLAAISAVRGKVNLVSPLPSDVSVGDSIQVQVDFLEE